MLKPTRRRKRSSKKTPEKIGEIAQAHPDQRIEVWFQDEARFGQQGTVSRKWAPTGSRPPAVKQTKYDWLYVIGAVCPATGQTVGMISPHIDTAITNVFLKEMARQIPGDVHVVLIWDQAGFHTAGHLKVPSNITLLPLPPYSPELNPTENRWHYLRSHHWSNREYADWDALDHAACDAWKKTCLDPELVKSICRATYVEPREVRA
jgi:transposase